MPATLPPSIFNDVVGPIMRGPSSSHSAASVRIGRLARDLCGGAPERVLFEFDTLGSLPTTHDTQGSDMGMFGGLLGWEADDPRLPESAAALRAAGCAVEFRFAELRDPHPNTYRLTLSLLKMSMHQYTPRLQPYASCKSWQVNIPSNAEACH